MLGLLDFANEWVKKGGLVVLTLIVFAESGLLVGFFLPGDSLLFFAGFLSSSAGGEVLPPLPLVAGVCAAAAIVGDSVGYAIGKKFGPALFDRQQSRFFNPANVRKAEVFFEKHGAKTIVLARFVPIVRTFVPTVAGVSSMHYRTFLTYNVVGGLLWGAGVTTLGYFLGEIEVVKNNIEIAAIVIVGISVLPIAVEFWKHRRARHAG
uniref:DedA protein n=1 Tax=uncultured bacterium A1Q1_fos_515 TaxID=1256581 RepID=L7VV15_9BACT|nr:DedA protein [uncultured bacterium A1Q1_fos_515]